MFKRDERIVQIDELADDSGYKIQATSPTGDTTVVIDPEPASFIDEVKYDGGNLFLAPLFEALLDNLRRKPANVDIENPNDKKKF